MQTHTHVRAGQVLASPEKASPLPDPGKATGASAPVGGTQRCEAPPEEPEPPRADHAGRPVSVGGAPGGSTAGPVVPHGGRRKAPQISQPRCGQGPHTPQTPWHAQRLPSPRQAQTMCVHDRRVLFHA